jgi:hypothetical protein
MTSAAAFVVLAAGQLMPRRGNTGQAFCVKKKYLGNPRTCLHPA